MYRDTNFGNLFSEPENEAMTFSASISPQLSKFSHPNSNSARVVITNTNNSDVGAYVITITATDNHPDTADATININFQIQEDLGCQINNAVTDKTFPAHTNISFSTDTTGVDTFTDAQNDAISRTGYDITPSQSFLTINSALNSLTISDPDNTKVGNYTVSIYWRDDKPDTGTANMTFNVEITENFAPVINNTISDYTAYGNRTNIFTLPGDLFYDQEGDTMSYTYFINPAASFIVYNIGTQELTIDIDNTKQGIYEFTLTARDHHTDTGSTDSKFNITITNNAVPTTTEVFSNTTMLAYYPFELVFNSSKFSDINGDTIH